MQIKITILDNPDKRNFYQLKALVHSNKLIEKDYDESKNEVIASGLKDTTVWEYNTYSGFISDNAVFTDYEVVNKIYKFNNIFPDNFSPIFNDISFNGNSYDIIIECPKIIFKQSTSKYHVDRLIEDVFYVQVWLDELSEEYYTYLKYWEHIDNETTSTFGYSNVENGIGIFGTINRSNKIQFNFKK